MTSIRDAAIELLQTNRHAANLTKDQYTLTEYRLVALARTHGIPWATIGQALGTTAGSARVTHDNRKAELTAKLATASAPQCPDCRSPHTNLIRSFEDEVVYDFHWACAKCNYDWRTHIDKPGQEDEED